MITLRRYLLADAERRLCEARPNVRLVPNLVQIHVAVSNQFMGLGSLTPMRLVWRLWWCAYCIERSAHHGALARSYSR